MTKVRPEPPPTTALPTSVKWDIPERPMEDWEKLLENLRGPLSEEAAKLEAVVPAQATLEFARKLKSLAGESAPSLARFATNLLNHMEAFETEAAATLLARFPELGKSLARAIASHTPD